MNVPGAVWLAPASWLFALGVAARSAYYETPLAPRARLPRPSIVVGNLSAGGTGKTSMVSLLVERFLDRGRRPAVLSRGYARPHGGGEAVVVGCGYGPCVPWEAAGDEPFLLSRRHPSAVVVAGRDRVRGARLAAEAWDADVLLFDDAFQYRRVRGDLVILMVDAAHPPWADHLLPRGRLREPASAAGRADFVVMVGADAAASPPAGFVPDGIPVLDAVHVVSLPEDLRGARAFLFSGIGNPLAFETSARQAGVEVAGHRRFRDHHRFRASDLEVVDRQAREAGARFLLTTEKDRIRVGDAARNASLPLRVLEARLELRSDPQRLERALDDMAAAR